MSVEIGRRVRELRQRRGLTQAKLARGAGLNQGFISEIERGHRNPSHASLHALASALQVAPAALLSSSYRPLNELPVYDAMPTGQRPAERPVVETYPVPTHLWREDRYVLRVTADSFEPTLKPDDLVLMQSRPNVDPRHVQGRICVCIVEGTAMLKRVSVEARGDRQVVVLRDESITEPPVTVDDPSRFQIQAVAVHLVGRAL
jgi:transcriptional regulator with XRE-family HTH domain